MPTLAEEIKRLNPNALRIFKQQAYEKAKQGDVAFTRLVSMPELADIFQESEIPLGGKKDTSSITQEKKWYEYPLEWIRGVEKGAGTLLAAPFTPAVKGTEQLPWWERERAEYEAWQAPQVKLGFNLPQFLGGEEATLGVKGALEMVPWFATAIASGGLGAIGWAGRTTGIKGLQTAATLGKQGLKPVLAVEKAVTTAPFKAAAAVAKPITKPLGEFIASKLPQVARFTAPASEVFEKQITQQDWQRHVAQMFGRQPFLKSVAEKVGGRAATVTEAVEDTAARALLIAQRVQETLLSKGQVAMANLRRIDQNPVKLFGVDEATGVARGVGVKLEGASRHIADIAEHPNNYILNPTQKAYIQQLHNIEDWVLDGLKEAGIDVKLLKFDEFSHWVHRVVTAKNIDEALTKVPQYTGKRIGAKASWEKTRFYETAAEGVKAGIIYEPNLERVVDLYVQTAAKRIGDQRIAEMVSGMGQTALERATGIAPEVLKRSSETARYLAGARQLEKVINRAIRGEKLTEATLQAQERRFPELGNRLRNIVDKPDELKALLKEAKAVEESAKAPYWQAKAERTTLMERARTPTLGTEATIWHPAFQGKIYPKEIAGEIQKYWDDMGWTPLNKLASISGQMRTLVAAADFSAPFIQGLPSMGKYPLQWGKAIVNSFKAFGNPKTHQEFLVKNADNAMEFANAGGFVGGFEYMEAMPQIQKTFGLATRLVGKPELGKQIARQTYGRFEASFGAFGDALRLSLWDALKARAKNPQELQEIARHINRMTGVMSQKALGVGATQRALEQGFLFFAPRYTRAGFALISDAFKGGLTGAETRKALGFMMAAGALAYYGTAKALGQEPNFDPSTGKFMTIEITDPVTGVRRNFGVSGMMTSLARLAADVTASTIGTGQNEPLDFVKLSRFDNPFIKFMYSKSAPLTGFMEGMVFRQNYFGEPFENPTDYGKFLAEQVLPIAAQQTFMEEGGLGATAIVGEFAGLRTFPQSDWEKRNALRDEVAQRTYGMNWQEVGQRMGELYQKKLEQSNQELQVATQKAQETSSKMARGEGKVWDTWRKEGQAVEESYRKAITMASQEFEQTGDGTNFRNKVDEANTIRRAMYATREADAQYSDIYAYFNEPLSQADMVKMNPMDLARREWYQLMYSPDMYDQYGNYNFNLADQKEAYFIQKYGQKAVDYIQDISSTKWDEPMPMKILREARSVLEPYWDIENQVWSQFPQELKQVADQISMVERQDPDQAKRMLFQYPQVVWIRKQIAQRRKFLKQQNPSVAQALRMFYTY